MKGEYTEKSKTWIVRDNENVVLSLPIEKITVDVIKEFVKNKEDAPTEDDDELLQWFDQVFGTEEFGVWLLKNLEKVQSKLAPENEEELQVITSTIFKQGIREEAVLK
jgi:hypothetical protein